MMCENVYQSEMCWEFSELMVAPCQSLMYPHSQIGTLPIRRSVSAKSATMRMPIRMYVRREMVVVLSPLFDDMPLEPNRGAESGTHETGLHDPSENRNNTEEGVEHYAEKYCRPRHFIEIAFSYGAVHNTAEKDRRKDPRKEHSPDKAHDAYDAKWNTDDGDQKKYGYNREHDDGDEPPPKFGKRAPGYMRYDLPRVTPEDETDDQGACKKRRKFAQAENSKNARAAFCSIRPWFIGDFAAHHCPLFLCHFFLCGVREIASDNGILSQRKLVSSYFHIP